MNKEILRMQMLAGIITEGEYKEKTENIYETSLSSQEKNILNDLVNTLNEGEGWIEKFKSYAKKGLLTLGIISALLAGPMLSNSQKEEVKDVIKTELPSSQDDLSSGQKLLNFYKNNPNEVQQYKKDNPNSTLVSDIENLIANKQENDASQLKMLGLLHKDQVSSFTTYSNYHMK
jgi:hypothetical protein